MQARWLHTFFNSAIFPFTSSSSPSMVISSELAASVAAPQIALVYHTFPGMWGHFTSTR